MGGRERDLKERHQQWPCKELENGEKVEGNRTMKELELCKDVDMSGTEIEKECKN